MSAMKKNVKEIIESSKSEEELLNNLDSLNRPLTLEELSFVNAGAESSCKGGECGTAAGLAEEHRVATQDDRCKCETDQPISGMCLSYVSWTDKVSGSLL